jgi:hypothetical protein
MVVGFTTNYLCNLCLSPLMLCKPFTYTQNVLRLSLLLSWSIWDWQVVAAIVLNVSTSVHTSSGMRAMSVTIILNTTCIEGIFDHVVLHQNREIISCQIFFKFRAIQHYVIKFVSDLRQVSGLGCCCYCSECFYVSAHIIWNERQHNVITRMSFI